MKVVIAMDSFKGSISAKEASQAVAEGLAACSRVRSVVLPMSDGGDGVLSVLAEYVEGTFHPVETVDLTGTPLTATYFECEWKGITTAFIESAQIVGLPASPSSTTVANGSSFGVGQVIRQAFADGMEEVIVFLGGTGVSDGGLGLLQAFGAKIYDQAGDLLPTNCNTLLEAAQMDLSELILPDKPLIAAVDVENPYWGKQGAFQMFAAQKGASEEQIARLDSQAINLAQSAKELALLNAYPGAGAAGGLGGGVILLGGTIVQGFRLIREASGIDQHLTDAHWVITGEGRMDQQSNLGKVPFQVAKLGNEHHLPVTALVGEKGEIANIEELFAGVFAIQKGPVDQKTAMEASYTRQNLAETALELYRFGYTIR